MTKCLMMKCFGEDMLKQIINPTVLELVSIDFNAIMMGLQHAQNGNLQEAFRAIDPVDFKLQTMLRTLMDYMSLEVDKSISEMTFTVNHIAPVLHGCLKFDPPQTQIVSFRKKQGIKPDRPDVSIKVQGHEVLFGEVTGPHQQSCESKNKWDLFRLIRFGKSFLDDGNPVAPIIQFIYSKGKYMRLKEKTRGMYLLEEVGAFTIPTTIATISSLVMSLPVLLQAK
ncbi:hypothetical protein BGZ76_004963, partial [Entomortierella beljakovae]